MQLKILDNYQAMSREAADEVNEYVRTKPNAVISFASGHTSLGMFKCLVDDVQYARVSFDQCIFVGLDEWMGIDAKQEGSCRYMMDNYFFKPAGIKSSQILFFNGMSSDPEKEVHEINQWLDQHGGLDIMLVGVGTNGHLAMNEPGTSFQSVAHISQLAEETIVTGQKYFKQQTPLTKGLTLGLKQFLESKLPILTANGIGKSEILKKALKGSVTEQVPASIIQTISKGYIILDRDAAKELNTIIPKS
jgi:glucosamine-6-phosphate isomerase